MAPVPNTRPNGDDEDPRPIKQPRLGEAEDSNEEKPKLKLDTDPMALDDQSPLVEVEDEPATNYNFEDINDDMLAYVNMVFSKRYKQWKSDLHQYFKTFDDPQVAFKEDEGVVAGGSKFPEIDVFRNVYVRPGDELAESFHATMMEKRQLVLQESIVKLPPETPLESVDPPEDARFQILAETLDQTLGRRQGTYCKRMGIAQRREPRALSSSQSKSQVTTLTTEVAYLRTSGDNFDNRGA
ncbi:uncharacterized protein LOC126611819 [Malus sylvestris]|uniref:uncharacterized protein LOC126611819 n=1 Tax=Malus sylvestris TaxID=3752 RepID=UPI0021AC555C|nr:uncharacterized protein LOC126611819 [Malus sylvestris]